MTKKEVTKVVGNILPKITEWYGFSKYQNTLPYLLIEDSPYSDADDPDCIGEYDSMDNDVVIYWKNVKNVEEIIRTLVHEYQHYLQSPRWMKRYYNMGYRYDNHPYEISARTEEENWYKFS
jgi:hypothetical protein